MVAVCGDVMCARAHVCARGVCVCIRASVGSISMTQTLNQSIPIPITKHPLSEDGDNLKTCPRVGELFFVGGAPITKHTTKKNCSIVTHSLDFVDCM